MKKILGVYSSSSPHWVGDGSGGLALIEEQKNGKQSWI
jgi:hypothetical protein